MELVGVAEIAEILGVSKQLVASWRSRKKTFPAPVAELRSGPVWSRASIADWARSEGMTVNLAESEDDTSSDGESRRAVVVAMMNMKGGVGKSTLSANFGWNAAFYRDLKVLLVDLDPQFNLSQYVMGARGYEDFLDGGGKTITDVFSGGHEASDVVQRVRSWSDGGSIDIVPANLELAWEMRYLTDKAHMLKEFVDEVRGDYDLIIIDCSPTESVLSTASYMASDFVVVPVRPEFLSTIGLPLLLRSLDEFAQSHKSLPVPELAGIVFNDAGDKTEHDRSRAFVQELAAKNGLKVFDNDVSHSESYPAGARAGRPIFMTDNARSWKIEELRRVADEFLGRVGL